MKLPIILTNFKSYERAIGDKALVLAKIHEKVARDTGVSIGIAVQPMDIRMIASEVSIPVFAQHVDPIEYGRGTGLILPEAVVAAGAVGTLLNHSERRLPLEVLEVSIVRAKEAGLFVVCCAESVDEGAVIAGLHPDIMAIEPPELIGGDLSVSTAKPEIITHAVNDVPGEVLVGAGVKTGTDVKIALELGAAGVLLASGVTQADDPEFVLRDLVSGMVNAQAVQS